MRTLGTMTLSHDRKKWQIQCEPHVAIRLKRVFAKIDRGQHGTIAISNTIENCRDLEWFIARYPLEVTPLDALTAAADEHRSIAADVAAIMDGTYTPPEFELAIPARDYQKIPASIVLRSGGLLVADDVGLGKTVMAIATFTDPRTLPALVVTLTHLPRQWQAEIARFAPKLTTHIVKKAHPYDLEKSRSHRNQPSLFSRFPDVLIMNYHKLSGWADTLAGVVKHVVFDEVQELRHCDSRKYAAAKHIADKATFRMGLSVGPESIVELRGGPFGRGWVGPIADAYRIAEEVAPTLSDRGYELCDVRVLGVEARGWVGNCFGWKRVKTFISHGCDRNIRGLRVAGDRLLLTDDHSVFRANHQGVFECVRSDQVSSGDILPVDDGADWSGCDEEFLDVAAIVADMPKAQVVVDLSGVSRKDLGVTAWQWQNFHKEAKFGPRLPITVYLKHRRALPAPTLIYGSASKRTNTIAPTIQLSDWAYVLGFFLGDGWVSDGNRVAFAVENARADAFLRILKALPGVDLDPRVRQMRGKSVEVRCSNRFFATVIERALGKRKCHEKSIPGEWIVSWPKSARLALLRGLIDSDGHVSARHNRLYFATTSPSLARTLLSLLRSLGVVGGMHTRGPAAGGEIDGRQIRGARETYVVNWSWHAMHGENSGRRGLRRRLPVSTGRFHEGVVRRSDADVATPSRVFDLEMDGHPSFVANGVLVHNSATPILNYGGEIHSVLDVVKPQTIGTREEFYREWCNGDPQKPRIKDPKAFGMYARETGLMLRRTRHDVDRELPALTKVPHEIDADTAALERIGDAAAELARVILKQGESRRGEKRDASEELNNILRQATGIAKAPYVADFVRLLVESGEKVVLYGWHRTVYSIWLDKLKDLRPVMFTGSESPVQKEASRQTFLRPFDEGGSDILIMSLRAGAGLDGLQHKCRTVVFGELDWSPGVHEQNIGRIYRDGQPDPVVAYFLISEFGSDPVVVDVLGLKRQQIEGLRDPNAALVAESQIDDDRMKRLAEAYLRQRNEPLPTETAESNDDTEEGAA